jgi:hypothetical protein
MDFTPKARILNWLGYVGIPGTGFVVAHCALIDHLIFAIVGMGAFGAGCRPMRQRD